MTLSADLNSEKIRRDSNAEHKTEKSRVSWNAENKTEKKKVTARLVQLPSLTGVNQNNQIKQIKVNIVEHQSK